MEGVTREMCSRASGTVLYRTDGDELLFLLVSLVDVPDRVIVLVERDGEVFEGGDSSLEKVGAVLLEVLVGPADEEVIDPQGLFL